MIAFWAQLAKQGRPKGQKHGERVFLITTSLAKMSRGQRLSINVPCCRLDTLFAKHQISKIDLMIIDVEGADWMVARQLFLETYRPRIVYLECVHLSGYEQEACAAHFRNYGYRVYIDQHKAENFLAVRPE